MIHGSIEVELWMGGSVMQLINRVSLITIQLAQVGYMPLTLMLILDRTEPRRSLLRISYDYLPDVISDLNTLYFLDAIAHEERFGDGDLTKEIPI